MRFRAAKQLGLALMAGLGFSAFAQEYSNTINLPAAPRRPCILLIVADSVGYGDLGCYGQTKIKTPNLDQLAADGMRFTACYAAGSRSVVSRASLLTGNYSAHSPVQGEPGQTLQANDVTIAETLTNGGYLTAAFGEWGLGGEATPGAPHKQGFDEWAGYLKDADAENYYPATLNRYSRAREKTGPEKELDMAGKYSDDLFTEAAMNFIKEYGPKWWNHYKAGFVFLPYTIVRANLTLAAKTGNGMEVPDDQPYTSEVWSQPEKNRASMISRLDRYVGMIRTKLADLKLDNVIIIFTSASGPAREGGVDPKFFQSTGPFRGVKGEFYEGGLRVPLIVWWQHRIKPGSVSEVPCALWDLPSTISDLAGVAGPTNTDGISLAPTLWGYAQTNRHASFYWMTPGGPEAIRAGDWKAVRAEGKTLELYDLKNDPGETTNVAAKNAGAVAQLESLMIDARKPRIAASPSK